MNASEQWTQLVALRLIPWYRTAKLCYICLHAFFPLPDREVRVSPRTLFILPPIYRRTPRYARANNPSLSTFNQIIFAPDIHQRHSAHRAAGNRVADLPSVAAQIPSAAHPLEAGTQPAAHHTPPYSVEASQADQRLREERRGVIGCTPAQDRLVGRSSEACQEQAYRTRPEVQREVVERCKLLAEAAHKALLEVGHKAHSCNLEAVEVCVVLGRWVERTRQPLQQVLRALP